MPASILEMADASLAEQLKAAYGPAEDAKAQAKQVVRFAETEKMLMELMGSNRKGPRSVPLLDMKEAVTSADFKILFPKIVSNVMQRPMEPIYIGQGLLARTIQVDTARIMEFPTLGAIRAYEVADTQELPEQDPSFSKNITEIRVRRFGLKLELSNEVMEESQWDILGLYTEAAGAAMMRKKEELIFNEYDLRAFKVFDNAGTDATMFTNGKGADSTSLNGTFDHLDLLDMIAALGANGYNPTDIVLHPLAWAIWAKDPFLRFQLLTKGGVGQTWGNFGMDPADVEVYVPFGLNVVITPFQTLNYRADPGTGVATGGTFNYTTITVLDRESSLLILQRTPMSIVQWENPVRDIRSLAFHERYGLSALNGGRSAVVAKNVKIDLNQNPLYTVRHVTVA